MPQSSTVVSFISKGAQKVLIESNLCMDLSLSDVSVSLQTAFDSVCVHVFRDGRTSQTSFTPVSLNVDDGIKKKKNVPTKKNKNT